MVGGIVSESKTNRTLNLLPLLGVAFIMHLQACFNQLRWVFLHVFHHGYYPNLFSNAYTPNPILSRMFTHSVQHYHLCYIEFILLLAFYSSTFSSICRSYSCVVKISFELECYVLVTAPETLHFIYSAWTLWFTSLFFLSLFFLDIIVVLEAHYGMLWKLMGKPNVSKEDVFMQFCHSWIICHYRKGSLCWPVFSFEIFQVYNFFDFVWHDT